MFMAYARPEGSLLTPTNQKDQSIRPNQNNTLSSHRYALPCIRPTELGIARTQHIWDSPNKLDKQREAGLVFLAIAFVLTYGLFNEV